MFLFNMAVTPNTGKAFRNYALVQEVYWIYFNLYKENQEDVMVNYSLMYMSFVLALLNAYPNDFCPPSLNGTRWPRELWDQEYLEKGIQLYKNLCKKKSSKLIQLKADYEYHLSYPASDDEVDWEHLLDIVNKIQKIDSESTLFTRTAFCIRQIKGPLAATRYLEIHKDNKRMKHYSHTHLVLGKYYYQGRKWKEARANFRKYLKQKNNSAMKNHIQNLIENCTGKLKK